MAIYNRGEDAPSAKLTEPDVVEILLSTEPLSVLAERYHVSNIAIWKVRHRKTWKHITVDRNALARTGS